jgi:tellurite resistance protein
MRRAYLPLLLLLPAIALARVGGGENYQSQDRDQPGGDDGLGQIVFFLIQLVFRHPKVGIPLLIIGGVVYFLAKRNNPTARTQRAFQQREAELRTQVSGRDVQGWVNALRLKDPSFELEPLLANTRNLFVRLQESWARRDLGAVRPFLSDATFQRLEVQLQLLDLQGVRDAIAEPIVLDLQLIGLAQNEWFDSIQLRVKASMRDSEVPASGSYEQAVAAAMKVKPEVFTEVWTFVRKPGAQTRIGADLFQGKCPSCGAPYNGGASNRCEFCGAVVNSGNYDWTLSEITQGIEHLRHHTTVDGLMQARAADPALNLEVLEDRASLIFWKWIAAQSTGEAKRISKVATGEFVTRLEGEATALAAQHRRKVFLECAVGAVIVRAFVNRGNFTLAQIEVRWSAKQGIGPRDQKPPALPTVPQRTVITLSRQVGATTSVGNGMSTFRCPSCNAPLTGSASSTCDYCGVELSGGEKDWVLASADGYERWTAEENARVYGHPKGAAAQPVVDQQERERLLYLMAAMAAADGTVDPQERKLLKLCAQRWTVSWANVELALGAGPQLFDRLMAKGTPEAEMFLTELVQMARIDGAVDRKERQMLQAAAQHLGVADKLEALLRS